jgi:hypothetical protein
LEKVVAQEPTDLDGTVELLRAYFELGRGSEMRKLLESAREAGLHLGQIRAELEADGLAAIADHLALPPASHEGEAETEVLNPE